MKKIIEHPIYQKLTKDTKGLVIFQETMMQLCNKLAGIPLEEAYRIVKLISKSKKEELKEYKKRFIEGSILNGVEKEDALNIWQSIEESGSYAFNKSHAVGYSALSYQTAWLKYYYPKQFLVALIHHPKPQKDEKEKMVSQAIRELRKNGFEVRAPNINKSKKDIYIADDGEIYMGLSSVAGCGDKAADEIISNQPYESFDDFLVKVQKRKVNIKIRKNLIQAGAFDKFGRRDELYYSLSDETFEKWDKEEILKREMLVLDLPSKEPLINYYENKYPHIELTDIDQIDFSDPIGEVWIKGIITNFVTKKASTKLEEAIDVLKEMVYFDIDDGTMKVNCFMSPEMFDLYKPLIGDGEAVILKAHTFGQKVYIDGVLNLTKENNISLEKYSIDRRQDEVDNMHRKPRWSINAVQSITYHVSKNGKRYGRITYDDGNFGLCFNMKVEDIQPGEIICWTTSKNPFINIVKRVE